MGLVLACGCGGRGGPHPLGELTEVANKPVLFYALDAMADAGIERVAIAVDRASLDPIRRAVGSGTALQVEVDYLDVPIHTGLTEAVSRSRSALAPARHLVALDSGIPSRGFRDHLAAVTDGGIDAVALVPRSPLAPAHADGGGSWMDADLDGARALLLGPKCLELVEQFGARVGGAGVAGLFHQLCEHSARVRAHEVEDWWRCRLGVSDLLAANRLVLEGIEHDMAATEVTDLTVHGRVVVHETARLESVVLRGPVTIGPRARLRDAYVGPYTSIGSDAVVEGAEIEHSIVHRDASIRHVGRRLEGSVIGARARVSTSFQLPSALHLTLGEDAEVLLG